MPLNAFTGIVILVSCVAVPILGEGNDFLMFLPWLVD